MYIVVTSKNIFRKIRCFGSHDPEIFWRLYASFVDVLDLEKFNVRVAYCSQDSLPDWVAINVPLTLPEVIVAKIFKKIWIEEYDISYTGLA